MRQLRPLLLLSLVCAPVAVFDEVNNVAWAQAAPAFSGVGLVEFLPAGNLIGDGTTPVQLHVLALSPDGSPMLNLKPKITANVGVVGAWSELGAGLYSVAYTPSAVDTATPLVLKLRGKNDAKAAVEVDGAFTLQAPTANSIQLSANPERLVLGQDLEGTISFQLIGGTAKADDLVVSASSGEIQNLTDMGGGKFTARYITPKVNYPHLALVAVADRRDPARTAGVLVIPLNGKTDYPVKAQPNASVLLRIGGREFGPVQAGADGRASVPVVVPPGVQVATLVSVSNGTNNEETIDLRVPETKRLRLMPLPKGLPSDATSAVAVRAVVRLPDGAPDVAAKLTFTTTAGTFGPTRHEGNGIYAADYTPPVAKGIDKAKFTVTMVGSATQVDEGEIALVPARPSKISLSAEPTTLAAETTSFKLFVKVLGPDGKGLPQRELAFVTAGAKLKAAPSDLNNGDYRADFATEGSGAVDILATLQTPATGAPLAKILVWPIKAKLTNDGVAATTVTVVTVDAFGHPVPNVAVTLEKDGDGALAAQVTTDANGVAQVVYTAGKTADLVAIRASASDRTGATAILQAPAGVTTTTWPSSGSESARAVLAGWAAAVPVLHIDRDGAVKTAAPLASAVAGPVATLAIKPETATIAPGATLTLRIKATDRDNRGVTGQKLELISSMGRFGTLTDVGNGDYTTTLLLPADAAGEVKLSVASADGSVASFAKVPVAGAAVVPAASTWGTTEPVKPTETVTPPPTEVTPEPVKPPKEPSAPLERPWLRVALGYAGSSYQFEQNPDADNSGPLLPDVLSVGGKNGGKNAFPQGFAGTVRGFAKSVPYIGFEGDVRVTRYSLTAAPFGDATAPDWLIDLGADVIGRYPFEAGGNQFHVGARAGLHYSDFNVFTGCTDGSCAAEYSTFELPGFDLGAEVGAEIGDVFLVGALQEGFYFATPYLTSVEFNAGYQFTPQWFGQLGFETDIRNVDVIGKETGRTYGTLSDTQVLWKVSVGYSL